MRVLKVLAITGVVAMLTGWSVAPAQTPIGPVVEIRVTCDTTANNITVSPDPLRLSLAGKETVKWIFGAEIGQCKTKEGSLNREGETLSAQGLNKIKIFTVSNLLSITPNPVGWPIPGAITGIPQNQDKEGEVTYYIDFLQEKDTISKSLVMIGPLKINIVSSIVCKVNLRGGDGFYSKILEAVEPENRCDLILVWSSLPNQDYKENITIGKRGKPLTIQFFAEGDKLKNRPIIRPFEEPSNRQVFLLENADNVTLEGLIIRGGNTGILIQSSKNITVRNVDVQDNNGIGILVKQSQRIILEGILASDSNAKPGEKKQLNGIQVNESEITIQGSPERQTEVHDNKEHGILIERASKVKILNATISGNRSNGIFVDGSGSKDKPNVKISEVTISGNKGNGITVKQGVVEELRESTVKFNVGHGISIFGGSTVKLTGNHIFRNAYDENTRTPNSSCGVFVDKDSKAEELDPTGPSNWIVANGTADGNKDICGGGTEAKKIQKREIKVPLHVESVSDPKDQKRTIHIQDAIRAAEPTPSEPYKILVEPWTWIDEQGKEHTEYEYKENLCIDRSITLQAEAPIVLQPEATGKPAISIADDEKTCPLHSSELANDAPTKITFKPSEEQREAYWTIKGGSNGVRIGTVAKSEQQKPVYIQVDLNEVTIQNQGEAGIKATAEGKGNIIQLNIRGSFELVNAKCEVDEVKNAATRSKISSAGVGILLDSQNLALVRADISNTEISNNQGDGLKAVYKGQPPTTTPEPFNVGQDLQLTSSRIVKNRGWGVAVESTERTQLGIAVLNSRFEGNESGGVWLKASPPASLVANLTNFMIQGDQKSGFGVQVEGSVNTTLLTVAERGAHQCTIKKHKNEGIHINNKGMPTAHVTITKLIIEENEGNGIFAQDAVHLTIRDSFISNNTKNGIALKAVEDKTLSAEIENNFIEKNRRWGITQVINACQVREEQNVFKGSITGKENKVIADGRDLSQLREIPNGFEKKVCPKELQAILKGGEGL